MLPLVFASRMHVIAQLTSDSTLPFDTRAYPSLHQQGGNAGAARALCSKLILVLPAQNCPWKCRKTHAACPAPAPLQCNSNTTYTMWADGTRAVPNPGSKRSSCTILDLYINVPPCSCFERPPPPPFRPAHSLPPHYNLHGAISAASVLAYFVPACVLCVLYNLHGRLLG